jgi:hypothetical protein
MSESPPKATADTVRNAYGKTAKQFDEFATAKMPETMRVMAERNLAQSRELYERSKDTLEAVLASWEKSFGAAGQGAVALNRKVIEIGQRNINAGFDYFNSLVGAKNLSQAMELQASYLSAQLDALNNQAEELRSLSSNISADVTRPIAEAADVRRR